MYVLVPWSCPRVTLAFPCEQEIVAGLDLASEKPFLGAV